VSETVGVVGVGLTFGGIGTAAAQPGNRQRQAANADGTLYEFVKNDPDSSILAAASNAAGLDVVPDGRRQYTVFAPDDDAFEAAGIDSLSDLLAAVDDPENVLLFHVTNGRRNASPVVDAPRVRMLNGEFVEVDGTNPGPAFDGPASIATTDIEASNGVAHRITRVLAPSE
jgi:uncharacterized surface protein with fasciclin (FAS1) repeats